MTLSELFVLLEAERPRSENDYAGNMTGAEVQEYNRRSDLSDDDWLKAYGRKN